MNIHSDWPILLRDNSEIQLELPHSSSFILSAEEGDKNTTVRFPCRLKKIKCYECSGYNNVKSNLSTHAVEHKQLIVTAHQIV